MVLLSDYLYGPPMPYDNMEDMQEGMPMESTMGEMEDDDDNYDDSTKDEEDDKQDSVKEEIQIPAAQEESSVRQRKVCF